MADKPAITGYRELSATEVAAINEIKEMGQAIGQMVQVMRDQGIGLDQRWVSIGATQLQQGLMALTRAVAQPTSF